MRFHKCVLRERLLDSTNNSNIGSSSLLRIYMSWELTVLSNAFRGLSITEPFTNSKKIGIIIGPNLIMRKLGPKEVK